MNRPAASFIGSPSQYPANYVDTSYQEISMIKFPQKTRPAPAGVGLVFYFRPEKQPPKSGRIVRSTVFSSR